MIIRPSIGCATNYSLAEAVAPSSERSLQFENIPWKQFSWNDLHFIYSSQVWKSTIKRNHDFCRKTNIFSVKSTFLLEFVKTVKEFFNKNFYQQITFISRWKIWFSRQKWNCNLIGTQYTCLILYFTVNSNWYAL